MSYSHVEALREYPDGVEVPLETRQEGSGHRLAAVVPLPESGPGLKLPIQGEEERALQYVSYDEIETEENVMVECQLVNSPRM